MRLFESRRANWRILAGPAWLPEIPEERSFLEDLLNASHVVSTLGQLSVLAMGMG